MKFSYHFYVQKDANINMDHAINREFGNACITGNLEIVQRLFSRVETDQMYLLTMRTLTVEHGHLNILKFFYENNVDIHQLFWSFNPLLIAAKKGWVDIIDYLLELGVDVNTKSIYDNEMTPLMYASKYGNVDIVDRLLTIEKCDVNIQDHNKLTALFHAVMNGHLLTY